MNIEIYVLVTPNVSCTPDTDGGRIEPAGPLIVPSGRDEKVDQHQPLGGVRSIPIKVRLWSKRTERRCSIRARPRPIHFLPSDRSKEMTGPVTWWCREEDHVCLSVSKYSVHAAITEAAPLSMGMGHLAISKLETREAIRSDDHGLWSGVRLDLIVLDCVHSNGSCGRPASKRPDEQPSLS